MAYKVYLITLPTGRYVGCTNQRATDRWRSGRGGGWNKRLCKDIKRFGWEFVQKDIVADGLTEAEAYDLEKRAIALCKSTDPARGYNLATGGKVNRGMKRSQETINRLKAAKAQYRRPVICKESGTQYTSLYEAEKQTGISRANISRAARGGAPRAGGLHWEFANQGEEETRWQKRN